MEIVFCVFAAVVAIVLVQFLEELLYYFRIMPFVLAFFLFYYFLLYFTRRAIYTATVNSRRRQLLFLCLFIYVCMYVFAVLARHRTAGRLDAFVVVFVFVF